MKTLVVIPAFDEADNIFCLLKEILSQKIISLDILVVNDHSHDNTADRVRDVSAHFASVKMMDNPWPERGLAYCYKVGFAYALKQGYEWIVGMDADLSHASSDIARLFAERDSADWIIGSRYTAGGSAQGLGFFRRLISQQTNRYVERSFNAGVKDMTSGFNCINRRVLERVDFSSIPSKGFVFQVEIKLLAQKSGFRFKEVPIVFYPRKAGRSKFSAAIFLESFLRLRALKAL
jgi:dolichol-phosphate mannosyltransferase